MSWTPPVTFVDGTAFSAANLNSITSSLSSKFNAGLTSADLSASAGIGTGQLAAAYEHLSIDLRYGQPFGAGAAPTNPPGGNQPLLYGHVPGTTSDTGGDWAITEVDWICTDTGAGTGAFNLQWGGYTGNPAAWNTVTTIFGAGQLFSNGLGGANTGNSVAITAGLPVTLVRQAYPCCLRLISTAADATLLTAATDFLMVTVKLRRLIAST